MFFTGQRPAVNAGISVSRVGGNAQIKAMKQVSSKIKLELAQYRELANFSQFGSDVDAETKKRLDHGLVLMEILKQPQYQPIAVQHQVMIIYAAINNYLADLEIDQIKSFEKQLASGTEYQKSTATGTGRTVRPHVRRAHWHHYWVGEGRTRLEVRWIEPTFVLPEGKREVPVATVRRVLGA